MVRLVQGDHTRNAPVTTSIAMQIYLVRVLEASLMFFRQREPMRQLLHQLVLVTSIAGLTLEMQLIDVGRNVTQMLTVVSISIVSSNCLIICVMMSYSLFMLASDTTMNSSSEY